MLTQETLFDKQLQVQEEQINHLKESQDETFLLISKLKDSLGHALKESRTTQIFARSMYVFTFLIGIVIICFALYFAMEDKKVLSIAFGAVGLIDIVAHLLANPAAQIQDARSNYAQLTITSLAWFSDFVDNTQLKAMNNQIYLNLLQSAENTEDYKQIINESLENYLKISNEITENTQKYIRLLEEVAEPTSKKEMKKLANELENKK